MTEHPKMAYKTGAERTTDAADVRYDLISPIGLRRLAETYSEGAEKYSAHNWEKGMPVHDLLNHALRHIFIFLEGDDSEDHLAHAAWNLIAAMHSEELWPELNEGHRRRPGCLLPTEETQEGTDAAYKAFTEAAIRLRQAQKRQHDCS